MVEIYLLRIIYCQHNLEIKTRTSYKEGKLLVVSLQIQCKNTKENVNKCKPGRCKNDNFMMKMVLVQKCNVISSIKG